MYRGQKYAELLSVAIHELELLAKKSTGNYHNGETTENWQNQAGTTAVNLRSLANFIDALRAKNTNYHGYPARS